MVRCQCRTTKSSGILMFSYRHAFHAGNHADVLKHTVLVHLIQYLQKKAKPFLLVDTHAGAAVHDLTGTFARKNAEFESGIARLWKRKVLPGPLADYVAQVRKVNASADLVSYPGSAQIAHQMLGKQDSLRLFELHSTESRHLIEHFRHASPRVIARAEDGFAGLRSLLPPPSRRGAVLMDPSYEDKADYQRVIVALRDAMERFATGTYAVWHPIVKRRESREYAERLKRAAAGDWLEVTLTVKSPPEDGFGLYGSGMFIFNPPWTLPRALAEILPFLVEALGQDASAGYTIQSKIA
jgi:23S rRNA (adenine2030-N6)-methyltransferase